MTNASSVPIPTSAIGPREFLPKHMGNRRFCCTDIPGFPCGGPDQNDVLLENRPVRPVRSARICAMYFGSSDCWSPPSLTDRFPGVQVRKREIQRHRCLHRSA